MNPTPRRARACGAGCLLLALRMCLLRRHLRRLGVPMTEQRESELDECEWCSCDLDDCLSDPCRDRSEAHAEEYYTPSGLDEFHGPTSMWVDPSLPVLPLFEEDQ